MAAISQTTLSTAFSWMKMFEFRLKFHWSMFLSVQFTIFQRWFRYWLGADQATSHYLNQWLFVHWRIYASLGLNELTYRSATHIVCSPLQSPMDYYTPWAKRNLLIPPIVFIVCRYNFKHLKTGIRNKPLRTHGRSRITFNDWFGKVAKILG